MSREDTNAIVSLIVNAWFSPADSSKLKHCIARYSKPEDFQASLHYMMHRICNAIKAVFGQSDWQAARNTLTDRMIYVIPLAFLVPRNSLDTVSDFALRGLVFTNETLPALPAPIEAMMHSQAVEAIVNFQQNYRAQLVMLKQGVSNTINVILVIYHVASPLL